MSPTLRRIVLALALASPVAAHAGSEQGGTIPGPLPLFPADNWWNVSVATAPVDPGSADFIAFINNGGTRHLHPDFGGDVGDGSNEGYGFPYAVVDGTQTKLAVQFDNWPDQSDGVDHTTETSVPFYPVPEEAITLPHWVEGGEPGNVDQRADADRHLLIVDRDHRWLYELYNVYYDGADWHAGSGAFFDLATNGRRHDGWTSADAAGLAILPGLVRYDEADALNPDPIRHALRVTVRDSNGYVYPASHRAGNRAGALPMGARLRLKASKNITGFPAQARKIFQAMKTYGLIVADNGTDMYISGTYDVRWDNDVLNPAFNGLTANDFDVIQLGWQPPAAGPALSIGDASVSEAQSSVTLPVTLSIAQPSAVTVGWSTTTGTATAGVDYSAASGTVSFAAGETLATITVPLLPDALDEPDETFGVQLSSPSGATLADAQGVATITDDDPTPTLRFTGGALGDGDRAVLEKDTTPTNLSFTVTLSAPSARKVTVFWKTATTGTATAGIDYTAASGTLSLNPGVTQKQIDVVVLGDTAEEPDETLRITLAQATNATVADVQAQGTIRDNDPPPSGSPTVAIGDATVTEGNGGTVILSFPVTLSAQSANAVSVSYATADGTALAGIDYVQKTGTLAFAALETSKTVKVTVNGDTVHEANETLKVNLTTAVFATFADAQGKGTIVDDDP